MSDHTHATVVPGCFRCDLGEDEAASARMEEAADEALLNSFNGMNRFQDGLHDLWKHVLVNPVGAELQAITRRMADAYLDGHG